MLLGHLGPCPEAVLGKKQYFPAAVNVPVKKKKKKAFSASEITTIVF